MEAERAGDGRLRNLGGSLQVENVQSLAASQGLDEILQRYIRAEIEVDPIYNDEENDQIPIIDMSRLLDHQFYKDEATKLKSACEEWGFFQLVNHGIPNEVIESMKSDIEAFFKLTLDEKKAFAQLPGTIEGYGQAFVLSDDQKLDWGDMFFLATQPTSSRNLRLWPTYPSTFRTSLDKYSLQLKRVANSLLELMAKNLGLVPEKLTDLFNDGLQSMRMNYYPPCPQANKVFGLSPHSDAVGLTLLLQVNEVQGLQIRRNGGWISIKPLPDAFIVNIGDIIEILSNGKYKSIEHRAIVSTDRERLSIAAFHSPNYDVQVGPLWELVNGSKCYKSLSHENFMRLVISSKLDGKSLLGHMKLKK